MIQVGGLSNSTFTFAIARTEQEPPQEPFILVGHTEQIFQLLTGVCLCFAFDILDRDAHVGDRRSGTTALFVL